MTSGKLQVRHGNFVVIGDESRTYAEMRPVGSVSDVLELARTFAAAPDLLTALKALHSEVQRYNIGYEGSELLEIMADARAAIAKAEGKQL